MPVVNQTTLILSDYQGRLRPKGLCLVKHHVLIKFPWLKAWKNLDIELVRCAPCALSLPDDCVGCRCYCCCQGCDDVGAPVANESFYRNEAKNPDRQVSAPALIRHFKIHGLFAFSSNIPCHSCCPRHSTLNVHRLQPALSTSGCCSFNEFFSLLYDMMLSTIYLFIPLHSHKSP